MSTKDLIQAAEDAQAAFDDASAQFGAAAQQVQQAQTILTAANQAVHDDLAENGACVIVDDTTSPVTVTMYTANDPDSFTATPIRVAE
jgi:hypothetical protein